MSEDISTKSEIELPSHGAWRFVDSYSTTAHARSNVIAVAGAPRCGKTTLIASLLHCFMKGTFGGFRFAGSRTLKGFDERCFLARTSSGGDEPDTFRTSTSTTTPLLHIRLRPEQNEHLAKDLLFLDVSGEDYRLAGHSVDECRQLSFLRRADHTALLIDGRKLSNHDDRQLSQRGSIMILQSLYDAGHLDDNSLLSVIVTKCDELQSPAAKKHGGEEFAMTLLDRISTRFARNIPGLTTHMIAARSRKNLAKFPLGFGLEPILNRWVTTLPTGRELPHEQIPDQCQFDRFGERTTGGK